jgi:hypothetical protein
MILAAVVLISLRMALLFAIFSRRLRSNALMAAGSSFAAGAIMIIHRDRGTTDKHKRIRDASVALNGSPLWQVGTELD